jgi:hypothetical protein
VTTYVTPDKPSKHMLVNGKKIKFKVPQNLAWMVIGAIVGAYIISALYYLITQVDYGTIGHTAIYLKPHWDHALSQSWWPPARHDIRDVYEGVLATLFAKSLITKKMYWRKPPVGWLRIVTAPFLVVLVAAPIVFLGIWLVDIRNGGTGSMSAIHTYQAYIIGFVAAQAAHRVWAPVGNTVQKFFTDVAIAGGHRPKFPLPPIVRERYQYEINRGAGNNPKHYGKGFTSVMVAMSAVFFFLAVYGGYVRLWIAKGH